MTSNGCGSGLCRRRATARTRRRCRLAGRCRLAIGSVDGTAYRKHCAADAAKVARAKDAAPVEHVDDGANGPLTVLHKLSTSFDIQSLKQKPEPGKNETFISVEAVREAQLSFIKKLHNLNNLLAGRGESNQR